MIQETNFEAIKAEILNRTKSACACTEQYRRAYKSKTLHVVLQNANCMVMLSIEYEAQIRYTIHLIKLTSLNNNYGKVL